MRLPAVPNPRFPPPNPAPDARGDRDAGRTPETSRASSDRRAWVGPPADADAARPRVGRRPPNDGSNAESDALAHRSRSSPLSPRDTPRSCSPSSAGGRSSSTAPRRPSRSDRRARREGRRERRGRARDGTSEPGTTFNNNENTFVPSSPATESARRYDAPLLTAVPTRFASLRTCAPWAGCRTRRGPRAPPRP